MLVVLILAACSSSGASTNGTSARVTSPNATSPSEAWQVSAGRLRDPVSLPGDLGFPRLVTGWRYVGFDVTITNKAQQAQPFALADLKIQDATGRSLSFSLAPAPWLREPTWQADESHSSTAYLQLRAGTKPVAMRYAQGPVVPISSGSATP